MAFTITSQPAALNFCGNLRDFVLDSDAAVTFKLYDGLELILEEKYFPDAAGEIRVDLEDVIDGLLSLQVPALTVPVYHQASGCKQFKAVFDATEVLFTVIKGGVDASVVAADFLAANFLTWQPQVKPVGLEDPQWLSYYAAAECQLMAKGYLVDGASAVEEIATLPAGQLSTVNVTYATLAALFTSQPYSIDLYIQAGETVLTWVQRFELSDAFFEFADIFVFENSLGGIDTVCFTGEKEANENFKFERGLFDDVTRDYQVDPDQAYTKNTGYFRSESERRWSLEFFKSLQKYQFVSGILKSVILPKQSLDSVAGDLNGYSFTFALAKQTKYLEIERGDLPVILNEHSPIYYGSSSSRPVTEADVLALPFSSTLSGLEFELPTNLHKYFTVAVPPQFVLETAFDPESPEDLTAEFVHSTILINSEEYNLYRMTIATPYSYSRNIQITLSDSGYQPVPLMVYYGASVSVPDTAAAVKLLQSQPASVLDFDLETGLNSIFTVATPSSMALFRVYDAVSEENLTAEYKPKLLAIDGKSYVVNTMQMAIPYTVNHVHNIKLLQNVIN